MKLLAHGRHVLASQILDSLLFDRINNLHKLTTEQLFLSPVGEDAEILPMIKYLNITKAEPKHLCPKQKESGHCVQWDALRFNPLAAPPCKGVIA